ncbi:L,D-transpeptidase [Rhodoblastus sphagnicola]|uniref:L,D-transpeptidase n=1 Tax=Rhodoblastus sphagnicola TaxID=333368 RepID=A0A2S6N2C2_9HYPH|nr:L,D-transpeptidase [Rhodoblastus sphagnicola]MBB4197314.1 lipoprotein-anchoring transpeptidase ErfK/SrfK [Rhodoblastus sphagnicola]PPQ28781.1 L,D-transpeptidase [Rhodoblastus sphagnicola]
MSRTKLLQSLVILASLGAFAAPADAQFYFFDPPPGPQPEPRVLSAPKPRHQPRPVLRDDDDDPGVVVDLHRGGSIYREPGVEPPRGGSSYAALPPDADPNYSTPVDLDNKVNFKLTTQQIVSDPTGEAAGTLTVNTRQRKLYYSLGGGQAVQYSIAVGKAGFAWKGSATIGRKAFWPGWTPPKEMLERHPDLPEHMDGALNNPLGARALYLFQGKTDTLFRIHGTNEPKSIGTASSSGCIRMHNADVIDLYGRVSAGTKVVVM